PRSCSQARSTPPRGGRATRSQLGGRSALPVVLSCRRSCSMRSRGWCCVNSWRTCDIAGLEARFEPNDKPVQEEVGLASIGANHVAHVLECVSERTPATLSQLITNSHTEFRDYAHSSIRRAHAVDGDRLGIPAACQLDQSLGEVRTDPIVGQGADLESADSVTG